MTDNKRTSRPRPIPSSRIGRLAGFGLLTAGIAGRTVFEGARRLSRGELPDPRDLLLTPTNILKLSNELSRMRGAALKLGQLISMDAGEFLPPELAAIMERLRADADFMPAAQLTSVLKNNWGDDWRDKFETFNMHPIAAASIGQVHKARTIDGKDIAVKVQYPGIKRSIDSDIDNVVALFRVSGLAPPKEKLAPLIADAKIQLREETDYLREAQMMQAYGRHLTKTKGFTLPIPQEDLTTEEILVMSFLLGKSIEKAIFETQETRDTIVTKLIRLCLKEVFEFQLMQSDPNFANYTYDRESGEIGLLDFGAMIEISPEKIDGYKALIRAGIENDKDALREAALSLGVFSNNIAKHHESKLLTMVLTVFREVMRHETYDFSNDALIQSLKNQGVELAMDADFNEIPPTEVIYLQRKIAGMYLLGRRLKAKVPIREMLKEFSDA